jgi:hypothetical protein
MKRTQIFLDDEIFKYLDNERKNEQKSISKIIRESIRDKMHSRTVDLISKMNNIFNKWKYRKIDPEKYIRGLRKDRFL